MPTQERVDHRAERGRIQGEVGRPRKLKKREREEIKIGQIPKKARKSKERHQEKRKGTQKKNQKQLTKC